MFNRVKVNFILSFLLIPLLGFPQNNEGNQEAIFPEPFAFSIHDVGWMMGNNDGYGDHQGPFRAGVDRKFDVQDYKAIVQIAKEAGVRIRGLFILAELDRLNVLRKYPTTTWERDQWDNQENISQEQLEIMEFVKRNASYLEFGLHGLAHEYWPEDGVRKRAEWYNVEDNRPWPEDTLENHIKGVKEIMAQYGISEANGHSFPESFDPCASGYYWNPDADYSLGGLMDRHGVKYVSTAFGSISELDPPRGYNAGGLDNGSLVICKIGGGVSWYRYSTIPHTPVEEQTCNMLRLHFPNFLAQDEFLQKEVNRDFIKYYKKIQGKDNRYLAKNTEQFYAQWIYKKYAEVKASGKGQLTIDNRNMPDAYYDQDMVKNMVVKIDLPEGKHIEEATINGKPIAGYFEEQGYGMLYLPPLKKQQYRLNYKVGSEVKMPYIYNDGTYNVYQFNPDVEGNTEIKVRVYGKQTIKIRNIEKFNPAKISSDNKNLIIKNTTFNEDRKELILTIKAHDIQGETGTLNLASIAYSGYEE